MDVKLLNPFVDGVVNVMSEFGFSDIKKKSVDIKGKSLKSRGVMINVGIVGEIRGNVVYSMDLEGAKKIASKMMMGMPVDEFNDMAQSAISEVSNMITAKASINFSELGIETNISTPALMYGKDFEVKMNMNKVIAIEILLDDIPFEINIAIEKR
ncbi:chemotaxis protein CheX [Dethiothermospora halolimnae]|uniref:chemotaxis protein CheX n=1 Tax=Dethiothermospora halolimnae TaxID=3114390 RepID=UPI003CCBDF22